MAEIVIAGSLFVLIVAFVNFPPTQFQQWLNFSLVPPGELKPDLAEHQRPLLTKTFLSAWATILLLTAALCFYIFKNSSRVAAKWWLLSWSGSLLSFLIHISLAFSLFGSWEAIQSTHRVTLNIWFPISITLWWIVDVVLALRNKAFLPFTRPLLHGLLFILFLWASLMEGELALSKSLGILMGLTVFIAFVILKYPLLRSLLKGSLSP